MNNQEKIKYWEELLKKLEEETLPKAMQRIGESGVGEWHENAEYEDAERQVQVIQVKISDVKQIIKKLKKEAN